MLTKLRQQRQRFNDTPNSETELPIWRISQSRSQIIDQRAMKLLIWTRPWWRKIRLSFSISIVEALQGFWRQQAENSAEVIGYRRWLTKGQKLNWIWIARFNLRPQSRSQFLNNIVIVDEKWVSFPNPHWKNPWLSPEQAVQNLVPVLLLFFCCCFWLFNWACRIHVKLRGIE